MSLADQPVPELDDYLDASDLPGDWRLNADRALARKRRAERRLAADRALAAARIAEIEAWRDARTAVHEGCIAQADQVLEEWMRAHHARTKATSETLPSGILKLVKAQPKLAVVDQPAAIAYATTAGYASWVNWPTMPDPTLAKAKAKKALTPGAVLPDAPTEPGYVAHEAYVEVVVDAPGAPSHVVMPGVVLLVPDPERRFEAKLTEPTLEAVPDLDDDEPEDPFPSNGESP